MSKPKFNKDAAKQFLEMLDPKAKEFSFHCYHPDRKNSAHPQEFYGTLDQHWKALCGHNKDGYGVYVCVNIFAEKRNKKSMTHIRGVWQEDDDGFKGKLPLKPSLEVESSSGKFHRYFLLKKAEKNEDSVQKDFDKIMNCMVQEHGSDKNAKDVSRVLRLPGLFNTKNQDKQTIVKLKKIRLKKRYSWDQIKSAFPCQARKDSNGELSLDKSSQEFTFEEAIQSIANAKEYYLPMLHASMSLANKGHNEATITAILEAALVMGKSNRPDQDIETWQQRWDGVKQMVDSAILKARNQKSSSGNILEHLQNGNDIIPEDISWEDKPFFAVSKFHLLAARGGSAKTSILIDVSARKTAGGKKLNGDGNYTPGKVLFITNEDGVKDTLLPRFIKAGGDRNEIDFIDQCTLDFNKNPEELEKVIAASNYDMVILDPVTSMTGDANTHLDSITKHICGNIARIAEKHHIVIIGIIHFKKGDPGKSDLSDMVTGSAGWVNSSRIAMACFYDRPTDTGYFGIVKSNIGTTNTVLNFKINIEQLESEGKSFNDIVSIEYTGRYQRDIKSVIKEISQRDAALAKQNGVNQKIQKLLKDFFNDNKNEPSSTIAVENYVKERLGQHLDKKIYNDTLKELGYEKKAAGRGKGCVLHPPKVERFDA